MIIQPAAAVLIALAILLTACDEEMPATTTPARVVCRNPDGQAGQSVQVGRKVYTCFPDGLWRER